MGKGGIKLELERLKVSPSSYNTYVDTGSVIPNSKRVVFRTKSEPINSRMHMNYGRRVFGQTGCKEGHISTSSHVVKDSESKTLYMMLQSPNEHCQKKESNIDAVTVKSKKPGRHFKSTLKRSTSVSEGDLHKTNYTATGVELGIKTTYQDSALDSDVRTPSSISCQPISRDNELSRTVVTTQPGPAKQVECIDDDVPAKDNCFRCLKTLQNIVNCCTCVWFFDACCYHCFKDDVGYTSWFNEMISCNKRPVENIRQWSLFGLATITFPCILFYPVLGGAVNQCLKCRLAKYHDN